MLEEPRVHKEGESKQDGEDPELQKKVRGWASLGVAGVPDAGGCTRGAVVNLREGFLHSLVAPRAPHA